MPWWFCPQTRAQILGVSAWLVAEELNVKDVEVAHGLEELVSYSVKPRFNVLGPRFGPRVKEVATQLAAGDAHRVVAQLESEGSITLSVGGEDVRLTSDDLDVRVRGPRGSHSCKKVLTVSRSTSTSHRS